MTIAYLNGQFLPLTEARVPAMDRGFLFGDGVYEVIPVYNNKTFRLEQHLQRFRQSLQAIALEITLTDDELTDVLSELIRRNREGNTQSLYLQATRGPAPIREHAFPQAITPTLFAYSATLQPKSITELSAGISVITVPDMRWQRCDIKAITLLANVLARQQAIVAGCQEAIFIHNNYAIEGTASNLFIVQDGVIITPPLSNHILGGITRDLILELAIQHNFLLEEADISLEQLRKADEIWLTSASREIMPVIQLDGNVVNNGKVGPLWVKIMQHYHDFKLTF